MDKEFIVNIKVDDDKAPENVEEIIEDTIEEGFDIINVANKCDYLKIKSIKENGQRNFFKIL